MRPSKQLNSHLLIRGLGLSMSIKIDTICDDVKLREKCALLLSYIKNPHYISIWMKCLHLLRNDPVMKKKLAEWVHLRKKEISIQMKNADLVLSFYEKNESIRHSALGKFLAFYGKAKRRYKGLRLFYACIDYPELLGALEECFFIFSDYRACIYFMTPSIDFTTCTRKEMFTVIKHFKENINMLKQILSKTAIDTPNPWGHECYASAYSMFETLMLLERFDNDPLKNILHIDFHISHKRKSPRDVMSALHDAHQEKGAPSISVSSFLVALKKQGYDIWFSIPLVFNTIYTSYRVKGLPDGKITHPREILFQKESNLIGVQCYLLLVDGWITSANIFKRFNKVF